MPDISQEIHITEPCIIRIDSMTSNGTNTITYEVRNGCNITIQSLSGLLN